MSEDLIERLTICSEGTASVPNIQRAILDSIARIAELETECADLRHDMERARDAANEHLAGLAEARRQALEEAAKVCEAHMSQCLDDRDIQKRWPQIKARNAVYAQAIRALASDEVKK